MSLINTTWLKLKAFFPIEKCFWLTDSSQESPSRETTDNRFWNFIQGAPICISINSVQGPSFLYILASTCYFGDFWLFLFGRCQAVSHCSFDLHFSDNYQCWPFFHMTIGHLHGFGKMPVQVFCSFFNRVVSFSDIDLCDLLIYLVKCARFI